MPCVVGSSCNHFNCHKIRRGLQGSDTARLELVTEKVCNVVTACIEVKMNSLIKTTIKRPVTICILVIILLAVGVLATLDMSTNLLPNIALPMMGITVVYPGAGAQSVEDSVTSVLESALATVPGIEELETISYDNVSVAILTFPYGTDIDAKIDTIEDTLKTSNFPDGCEEPTFIKIDMNGTATATIAMYNPDGNGEMLKQDAETLATKLRAIEGVGSVDVMGVAEKQIRIEALVGLDITSLAIVQALQNENLDIPLGTILQDGTVVSIRNASDATSLLDVMQLPATLPLNSSAMASLATLKSAVKGFVTSTKQQFDDNLQKALDARELMEDIESKTADELEEDQNNLAAVKALMTLVKNNSSQQLRLMWHTIDVNLVQNDEFVNMDEENLRLLAEDTGISYDLLSWLQDGAKDGTLKENWFALVEFREIFPYEDTDGNGEIGGEDITYDQFANLFQDGGKVTVAGEGGEEVKEYRGLDLLHSDTAHENCDADCERETFSHEEAVDVCEFANSVNTVAYNGIIQTKRDGEEITDEQFAALFVNSEQGNSFAALLSPQVIHVIRLEHFNDGNGSIVDVLTKSKYAHVDADGNAVYKNGVAVTFNEDDEVVVKFGETEFYLNNFGRVVNEDGKLVDEQGRELTLTDDQKIYNYNNLGEYVIYSDGELLDLYQQLQAAGVQNDFGITPTPDTIRFVRVCDFDTEQLLVPLAYLGHVEQVEDEQSFAQYNGSVAVTLRVFANADADTTKVVENVRKTLAGQNLESVAMLLDDKAAFISDSVSNVLSSIIIGGVLAVLVIYLFVRKVGSSLVISITMPLSVLVALLGLWAMHITLNMVSLGGLAVGIGMLVDNSIVVLESITKRRDAGESVFDSCLNGTREVAGSLLASTLTNVCVFVPILFARGLTREIFYDLVWAVTFSIVMSLFVAITVIPSLYHLIYKKSNRPRYKKVNGERVIVGSFETQEPRPAEKSLLDGTPAVTMQENGAIDESNKDVLPTVAVSEEATADVTSENGATESETETQTPLTKRQKFKRWWNNPQGVHKMEGVYGSVLSKLLKNRVLVCLVAFAVFGASIALVFTTGTEFLPAVDKGLIEINMSFDGSATLEDCKEAGQIAATLISQKYGDNLQYVSLTVGKQGILETNNTNVLRVQLNTGKLNTAKTTQEIRELLQNANLNAQNVSVSAVDGVVAEVTGGMSGQSVTLLSDNMDLLAEVAGKIAVKLQTVSGVASVTDNTAQKTTQISFTFDKEECARRGVDYQNAVMMLRVGLAGYTAANLTIDGETQNVVVQFGEQTKNSVDALYGVVVGFDEDGAVTLSDVIAEVTESQVVSVINKSNGRFVTTIDLESYGVDTGTLSKRIAKVVNEVLLDYPEVTYEEGGVAAYLTDAFNGLVVSLVAAFLLLYGVMACQFESLLKPFIVIMSIPLGFTGGFLALAITGMTLNVVSFVGLIMLMGVIVNDAIVLVDKIDMLIAEGKTPKQAVVEGSKSRLRPILMTTLTTVLALIPLALGLGRGDTLMQPMGIAVIGGLTLGTLVTLVIIPCFYCIVKRINFKTRKQVAEVAEQPAASEATGE